MAGHNKWSQIKHKKAKTDAQKGKVFSKMARELTIAAKQGGGDPGMNARLRLAIQKAKDANMPNDNITRAIEKGLGGGDDVQMEEILYEAYGPGGVAFLIETLTDNKNRTVSNVRAILTRANGSLANKGAVSYLFDKKGLVLVASGADVNSAMELAIESGAEDVDVDDDGGITVKTAPDSYEAVRIKLEESGIVVEASEMSMVPQTVVDLEPETAQKVLQLVENLENDDDVQNVFGNYAIPDDVMETVLGATN